MVHNQKTRPLITFNRNPVVIYPVLSNNQDLATDFYLHLSILKSKGMIYQWLNYDFSAEGDNRMIEFIQQFKNNLIFLYIPDIIYFSKLNNYLKRLKDNNCFIMIGGSPTITVKAAEILNIFDSIDVIVRAPESEKVLVDLLKGIGGNKPLESISGITFRQYNTKKIITTPGTPLTRDMDYLYEYELIEKKISKDDWYPVLTSRGCNQNCQYCGLQVPYRMNHTGKNFWRARSPQKIVDEIERLISMGTNKFVFYCEQFFNPKEARNLNGHGTEIAYEILRRKLKPRLTFIAKSSDLVRNFESLFILRDAGLEKVDIGIDSGLKRFHQMYETGSSVQDNLEILKRMHEHRFNFDISFVFLDPYISIEEIEENLYFLEKISIYFSHLPIPYSVYLDSRILNSVLILRHGMPIIHKLKLDNLIIESPNFSRHPEIKFKDPRIKKIYSIYKIIEKKLLPSFKSFYNNKGLIEKDQSLNLFPLKIMRKIATDAANDKINSIPQYILDTAAYLKSSLTAKAAPYSDIFTSS
jgi:radical SAM superfamily enzyme YgiQ (UPF0313 family)